MNDEHTFDNALAAALRQRNPRWRTDGALEAEPIGALPGGRRPDVLLRESGGSPVVIETEFRPAATVERDARSRLGETITGSAAVVEHAVALRAPADLREVGQHRLESAVGHARFEYCLWSLEGEEHRRWPAAGWLDGDLDALAGLIESGTLSERLVARMLESLEKGVAAATWRLRDLCAERPDIETWIAERLHQARGEQTTRMGMAIIANALTFQTMITGFRGVLSIRDLVGDSGFVSKFKTLDEWERILRDINYWPIFEVACQVLRAVPEGVSGQVLTLLAAVAQELADSGVTRSHDLSGRLFQRLITDRKFLATFYTRPAAATLLAEMAVAKMAVDWSDAAAVKRLRLADFACGTGTLLTAAYRAVARRHRRTGGDDRDLHAAMIEQCLIATDIMPAATHLTTSMLASANPATLFGQTSVYTLPYGRAEIGGTTEIRIGALDLLDERSGISLFPTGIRRVGPTSSDAEVGGGDLSEFAVPNESLDLVIMNPPFTRPTNHEIAGVPVPSFAGFDTSSLEQRRMSEALRRRKRRVPDAVGHGNAGLASNFLDLAQGKLKPGGTLALVMPLVLVSGAAWRAARRLLDTQYEDLVFVTIAQGGSDDRSFSADTGMAEVLVVARKRSRTEAESSDLRTTASWVALRGRPRSEMEAEEVARRLADTGASDERCRSVLAGESVLAQVIEAPVRAGGCAQVSDLSVAETALALEDGALRLPGRSEEEEALPMTVLSEVGKKGPLHRDINGLNTDGTYRGPFDILPTAVEEVPTWPVLWSHEVDRERRLTVAPDRQGRVRPGMEAKAERAWESAAHLHFNLDFQVNAQPLAACWTADRAMGGRAWPTVAAGDPALEKALLLWANTTLGLLLFWWKASRQQSGRASLTGSRLVALPVLDVRRLESSQLAKAAGMFDDFSQRDLLAANEAWRDPVRADLDRAVLVELLGLPERILEPLALLRRKWCAEPSVHGGKPTRPTPAAA